MTFLPILVRELRARGHNSATYWGRTAVAAVGLLACAPVLFGNGPLTAPILAARGGSHFLLGVAFLLCCGGCLVTADAVSRERREGTLGLLLLTRVSHWDVLLGKFASNGVAGFAALIAFTPVLMLPLLAGGMTAGEAVRNAAALANTLFLALAVGLCVSAAGFHRFRTVSGTLMLMAALVFAPLMLGSHVSLASPLRALTEAGDSAYRASPARFWISIGLIQAFAWMLLCGAVVGVRRRTDGIEEWLGKRSEPSSDTETTTKGCARVREVVKCRYCGRQNASDSVYCRECGTELYPKPVQTKWTLASAPSAFHWLLGRQRGPEPMLWIAAVIQVSQLAISGVASRWIGAFPPALFFGFHWGFGFVTKIITGILIAFAASRFLLEARRDGTLELLFTTPLGAEQLVPTQWDMLKRMIRLPLLFMLLPLLLRGLFLAFGESVPYRFSYVLSLFLDIANVLLGVGALGWLALWFGLRETGQARTILWTVLVAVGVPCVLSLAWSLLIGLLGPWLNSPMNGWWSMPVLVGSVLPQAVTLLFYLFLIHSARSHLLQQPITVEPFSPRQSLHNALLRLGASVRRARRWPG